MKNWCFWTVVLEKTLQSPLDCKIKPDNPKGNQSWIFIGRTDAEAEAPIPWPPDAKSWLIGKDSDAGKDWRQEKEMTEGEMMGWHHRLNGHEFEQAPGDGEGQGGLACFSPWVAKSWTRLSDWTITGRYEPWCHAFWNIWELDIFSRDLRILSGSLKLAVQSPCKNHKRWLQNELMPWPKLLNHLFLFLNFLYPWKIKKNELTSF